MKVLEFFSKGEHGHKGHIPEILSMNVSTVLKLNYSESFVQHSFVHILQY